MSLRLLIIDDDTAVTELLTLLLRTHGFETAAANRGADGVKLARETKPDVIILDLMLPEMDGWAVCREVRSFSNVPILILSALNDPATVASILDAGADDYLTKPTVSAVLVAHINKLARRSGTGSLSPGRQQQPNMLPGTSPLAP